MIRIVETTGFERAYMRLVRRRPELRERLKEKITLFVKDPYHPSLKTHKLTGNMEPSMAFSLTHKLRVVFSLIEPDLVAFEDIGTHDDVY